MTAELLLDDNLNDDVSLVTDVTPTKIKIMLEETAEIPPGGQFFQLDGKAFLLRAGEETEVPEGIVNILDLAVMSVPVLNDVFQVIGYKNRLRFPYRIITGSRKAA
jgi:hypothetical protein